MKYTDKLRELHDFAVVHAERVNTSNWSYRLKVTLESDYLRVAALEPFDGDIWAETGVLLTAAPRTQKGNIAIVLQITATVSSHFHEAKPRLASIDKLDKIGRAFEARLRGVELEP